MRSYFLAVLLLLPVGLDAAEPAKEVATSQPFVIGISPFLEKSVKDEVKKKKRKDKKAGLGSF